MKPIVIGNWKMHLTTSEARAFLRDFMAHPEVFERAEVTLCPASPVLPVVADTLRGTAVRWGGQNAHWESQGAFTGETSMAMLADLGCTLVLCGHSERRSFAHETDADVCRKVEQAVAHGMTPVLCVGETYEQRHQQQQDVVVIEQIRKGVDLLSVFPSLTLYAAYEPRWAIGTGQAIEPADAIAMARLIRSTLREELPTGADSVPILYGGSVTPLNVASFVDGDAITGVLVGGASLDPVVFYQLIAQLV
jgi:triosephosphate isomerase